MNWRRGFFRLWVLGSALFVIAMAISNYAEIKHQFDLGNFEPDVPVLCSDARGVEGTDFSSNPPWEEGKDSCWYTLSKFRPLYPEYKDLSDEDLIFELYKKRGFSSIQHLTNPWMTLLTDIGIAFGVPLIVLILGTTLAWVLSGFKATAA
jgi:hypothetical protein